MSEKILSNEEIIKKISEQFKNIPKTDEVVELNDDELNQVYGGVDSFAFEQDGYVISAICNNPKTIQTRDMMPALARDTACMVAPAGTSSCYSCTHFSMWRTAKM